MGCGGTGASGGNDGGNNAGGGGSAGGGGGSAGGGGTAGGGGSAGGGGGSAGGGGSSAGGGGSAGGSLTFSTIFTILLENHDYKEVVGDTTNAPYINSLIAQYGLATNYMDANVHPSLPNYLYLISGSAQGVSSDFAANTKAPFKVDNLGNQMTSAKIPWRAYAETMGTPCATSDPLGSNYTSRHIPFLYFDDIVNGPNTLCANTNVDYSNFAADLAAGTYRYMWITPNLIDDGHGGPLPIPGVDDPVKDLQASDNWLKAQLPNILSSTAFKSGGVIFITWDEAEGRNGDNADQIPMIVISPKITKKTTVDIALSHASYLATIEDAFGLPRLGDAQKATNLAAFFP